TSKRDWSSDVCSSDLASAHSQYIGIVVQAGRFRTEAVRTQRRADSRHLIGCNGNADSGSADQDSLVAGTLKDRVSYLSRINRIEIGSASCREIEQRTG